MGELGGRRLDGWIYFPKNKILSCRPGREGLKATATGTIRSPFEKNAGPAMKDVRGLGLSTEAISLDKCLSKL